MEGRGRRRVLEGDKGQFGLTDQGSTTTPLTGGIEIDGIEDFPSTQERIEIDGIDGDRPWINPIFQSWSPGLCGTQRFLLWHRPLVVRFAVLAQAPVAAVLAHAPLLLAVLLM